MAKSRRKNVITISPSPGTIVWLNDQEYHFSHREFRTRADGLTYHADIWTARCAHPNCRNLIKTFDMRNGFRFTRHCPQHTQKPAKPPLIPSSPQLQVVDD